MVWKREQDIADKIYFECKIKEPEGPRRSESLIDVVEPQSFEFTNVELLRTSLPANSWTLKSSLRTPLLARSERCFRTYHTDVSNNRLTIDHGCYYFDLKSSAAVLYPHDCY